MLFQTRDELKDALDSEMRAFDMDKVLHIVVFIIFLYCTMLHCIALYCTVLHCIALYCTVLHCIALYCAIYLGGLSALDPKIVYFKIDNCLPGCKVAIRRLKSRLVLVISMLEDIPRLLIIVSLWIKFYASILYM